MKSPADITRDLIAIIEPVCQSSGYELVDVDYTSSPAGWVVRVYIDRSADSPAHALEGGAGPIGLADCERLSRELGAVLDVEDPLPHAYSLEVSSPGLDRPLRTAAHFQRYAGETVKITLASPLEGRKNFKGVLRGVDPAGVEDPAAVHVLVEVDGTEFRLPLGQIGSARVVPDWDALMKRRGAAG